MDHSFSQVLTNLKRGDELAVQVVWDRFFEPLQKLAMRRIETQNQKIRDGEDLALSAINAFHQSLKNGRYIKIDNREDVWQLLITIVERKAIDHIRREHAIKRGAGKVHGDSFAQSIDHFAAFGINHEERLDILDQIQVTLSQLDDPLLLKIVYAKIEGFTNQEVAEKIGRSLSSVERKLRLARRIIATAETSDSAD